MLHYKKPDKADFSKQFIVNGIIVISMTLLLTTLFYNSRVEYFVIHWNLSGTPTRRVESTVIMLMIIPMVQSFILWYFVNVHAICKDSKSIFTFNLFNQGFTNVGEVKKERIYRNFIVKCIAPLGIFSLLSLTYVQILGMRGLESMGWIIMIPTMSVFLVTGLSIRKVSLKVKQ